MALGTLTRLCFLPAAWGLVACQGLVGDPQTAPGKAPPVGPSGTPVVTPTPTPVDPCAGRTLTLEDPPLRRLSGEQYQQTVRDLLGDPGFVAGLDDEAQVITERGVRELRDAAESAIERRAQWTHNPFPCDPFGPRDDSCAAALVDQFGTLAFRRPLHAEERSWLLDAYAASAVDFSFEESLEMLVELILQAPGMVYVDEGDQTLPPGIYRLDDWALASRLSYFLWGTMPDAGLIDAAAHGQLTDPEGLRAEAERLLQDPRAAATIERFVWHWLQLDGGRLHHALEEAIKDPVLFPEFGPELQTAMRTELEAFVRRTMLDEDGSFDQLLNSREAYVNGPLAQLYGVSDGPQGDEWAWVELKEGERGGLLTRAAFLTVFGSANVHSPIRRGVFVIEELLCNELGDPPPNANDVPVVGGTVDDNGTQVVRSVRQDVETRTRGDECIGCHSVINPVGFTFEHYDAIGRYRQTELGTNLTLDSTGKIQGSDVDGPVSDALELSHRLAQSQRARGCFARRWASAALGQPESTIDQCAVAEMSPEFLQTGGMRTLILDLVASEAFTSAIVGGTP